MKILFFMRSLDDSGGTERVCCVLAGAFSEQGHEVGIVSIYGGLNPFFYLPGSVCLYSLFQKWHRLNPSEATFMYIMPMVVQRLRRVLNIFHPDVVINVDWNSVLCCYSLPALRQMNARNITWEHISLDSNIHSRCRRVTGTLATRWADAVVTLTERDRVNWRKHFRPRVPVVVIPNPCANTPCADTIYREDSRTVLAAGHLIRRKGFDLLLQAWGGIAPGIRRDWRLRLVGSGKEEDALKDLAANLGIADTIDFVGRKEEMAEEYRGAGLFVLSSRAEGLPMVLLEAMSFGIPVVAFDCKTGPAEIVIHGRTGLLAPPEDVPALSQAMGRMIGDSVFRCECARKALQRARDYSIERILKEWRKLIDGLSA
jgi:glycosyltransferase involved in cell wall biosynthesis